MTTDTAPTISKNETVAADGLVTEEMVKVARAAYEQIESYEFCMIALEDALRAVAPMIAARVATLALPVRDEIARRDEREACAKIAENRAAKGEYGTWQAQEGLIIATAIRARGEPTT
jgi:hypothetical protein